MTPETIKAVRLRLEESQEAFAKRFGVDQSTIQRWETKGTPDRGAARVAIERVLAELSDVAPPTAPADPEPVKAAS